MNLKLALVAVFAVMAANAAAEDTSDQATDAVSEADTAALELQAAANQQHRYLQQTDNDFYSAAEAVDLHGSDVPADSEVAVAMTQP